VNPSSETLAGWAEAAVEGAARALPEPLRRAAAEVAVRYAASPEPELLDEGWPEDLLGLFSGPDAAASHFSGDVSAPTITLYLLNLYHYAERERRTFERECRKTYLHELGHYIGFDEDDLADRGMD